MTASSGPVDARCPIRETVAWRGSQAQTDPSSLAALQDLVPVSAVVAPRSLALTVSLLVEVSETPEAPLFGVLGALSAFATLAPTLLPTELGVAIVLLVLPVAPALGLTRTDGRAILLVFQTADVAAIKPAADLAG